MVRMYDWKIKRSGIGMVIIGVAVFSDGSRMSEHKLHCHEIETIAGEIVASSREGTEVARLSPRRTIEDKRHVHQ